VLNEAMRHLPLVTALLILGSAATRIARAEQPEPLPDSSVNDSAHLRALYKKAQAAFEANDFEQARGLFLQAWAIQPSAEIALGLGQSELELKRHRDCAEHLDYAIRNMSPTVSESVVGMAKKALAEVTTQLGVIRVATNRDGAEIRVDGKAVGKAPLGAPLFLEPGNHEIAAHFGTNGITRPVSVQAGQETSISLPVITQTNRGTSPWASGAPRATIYQPATNPPSSESPHHSIVPVIIGGATFLAGITTAVVFRIDSNSQFSDADALRARLAGSGCQGMKASVDNCAALMTASQNGDRSRNWSTAGLVVATGALLGTIAYWYWPNSGTQRAGQTTHRIELSAGIANQASGIVLSGDY
jgi:hypothetical protein